MRTYTKEENKRSLTVSYPVSRLHISLLTPVYPRVPFTVGYAFTKRNKTLPIGERWTSAISIYSKTRSHV